MKTFNGKLWVVQTNDGYYVHTMSFHVSEYGAQYQCAHDMNEEINAENQAEADKFQIVIRELEL